MDTHQKYYKEAVEIEEWLIESNKLNLIPWFDREWLVFKNTVSAENVRVDLYLNNGAWLSWNFAQWLIDVWDLICESHVFRKFLLAENYVIKVRGQKSLVTIKVKNFYNNSKIKLGNIVTQ